jgi:hypothetical protein
LLLILAACQGAPETPPAPKKPLREFRGIIHCHSLFSHDSKGTYEEILAAAKAAKIDFICMTDHPPKDDKGRSLREGWTVSERVQRELFAEQEEQKKEEGRRTAREAENARKEAAARVMEEMSPAARAALESEARATIRQKLPRARETSKAFQSALAEEMRRRALETG